MITTEVNTSKAFPMLGDEHLVDDFPEENILSQVQRRQGRFGNYRLVAGVDSGPRMTWIVWALAGHFAPEADESGFIVLNQLAIHRCTPSFQAGLIADFHEATGFPGASALFIGPSCMSDRILAAELGKKGIHERLATPALGSSRIRPRAFIREIPREGMGRGWATIAGLLKHPTGIPLLLFCPAAYPTYYELMRQVKGRDEHHVVGALRHAVMGWRENASRILDIEAEKHR